MKLSLGTQSGRHAHVERGHDLYQTPSEAVEALLCVETLPQFLWDPCCGRGAIVNVLRATGRHVIGSDLINYGDPTHFYGRDFLKETKAPKHCGTVVTNPPFRLAQEFVEHALRLVPFTFVLLRLAFLESERRRGILDTGKLARVHIFRNRLPMMHRDGWIGPRATSAIAFAWFCFDRDHAGPIVVDRISWTRNPK